MSGLLLMWFGLISFSYPPIRDWPPVIRRK